MMANEEKIKKEQAEKDAERTENLTDDVEKKDVDNDGDTDVVVKDPINTAQLLLDIKELLLSMRDVLVSRETTEKPSCNADGFSVWMWGVKEKDMGCI